MSKEEPPASSSAGWKYWLGAGLVAAALAGGYVLLSRARKEAQDERKKHKVKKDDKAATRAVPSEARRKSVQPEPLAQSTASTASLQSVEVAMPTSAELQRIIKQSLDALTTSQDLDRKTEKDVHRWLRQLNYSAENPELRVMAVQWLTMWHTLKMMAAHTLEQYREASKSQETDMITAWEMLQLESWASTDARNAADLLRCDVAQRLRDGQKIADALDRVVARSDELQPEEVLVAFTTAPLIGRWRLTRELGDRLGQFRDLSELHQVAMQRPDIPDLEALYILAESEQKRGDTPLPQLKWVNLLVSNLRIRVRDVICDDEERKRAVRERFSPSEANGWIMIPTGAETRILRTGAIAQLLSFSMTPIPMAGPMYDDRIHVMGYAVIPGGEIDETGEYTRLDKQTETYTLQRQGDTDTWEGQYELVRENLRPGRPAPVTVHFDTMLTLRETQ